MLRINQSKTLTLATVDVDGKLVGPWVDEVRTTVTALLRDQAVCLNLQHLSFADAAGLSLLFTLRNDGILLIGASPLIDGLLKSHGDRAAHQPAPLERKS
jgi:anti-anti-sigma regulatory factor